MMIYRYLLSKKLTEPVVHIKKELFRQPKRCSRDKATPTIPTRLSSQLLRVCRQIYHEAIAILYSENVFKVNELHVLHEDFLCSIGVRNLARLSSVTIEVGDDEEGPRPGQDSLQRVSLAVQDILATFQKHQALRSIQNFSVTITTSNKYPPLHFPSFEAPDDFMDVQPSLQMLRRILALSTLVHCGFCESHDLEEESVKTSAGWLETTMSLAKLVPEVCETQKHPIRLQTANVPTKHASERAKVVQKRFAKTQVQCTGNWNCSCWTQKGAVDWPGWSSLSEVSSEGWKLSEIDGLDHDIWAYSWLETL